MALRARFLVVAVALGAVVAVPMSVHGSDAKPSAVLDMEVPFDVGVVVVPRGDVKGIVSAVQRDGRRKLGLSVSLHGLKPGTNYRVVVSRRPCSEPSGTPIASLSGPTGTPMISSLVNRNGSLRKARSVRIFSPYVAEDPTSHEVGCHASQRATSSRAAQQRARVALGVFAKGKLSGIVAAVEGRRLRLSVSLHGLEPNARYRLVGSRQPCSRRHQDPAVFSFGFDIDGFPDALEGFLASQPVRANAPLRSASSIRVFERSPDGTVSRRLCRRPYIGESTDGTGI